MNRPSLVINRCGSWGIRTPGTRNCARQFSKLLVSATHPNFQSFGSLTSQHSFSECGCKGMEKKLFRQTFLRLFSKNSLSMHENGSIRSVWQGRALCPSATAYLCVVLYLRLPFGLRTGTGPAPARHLLTYTHVWPITVQKRVMNSTTNLSFSDGLATPPLR